MSNCDLICEKGSPIYQRGITLFNVSKLSMQITYRKVLLITFQTCNVTGAELHIL